MTANGSLVESCYVTIRKGEVARTVDILGDSSLMVDVDASGYILGVESIGSVVGSAHLARILLTAVLPPTPGEPTP